MTLTAQTGDDGRRLDRVLRRALPDIPLSALHRFLRKRLVLIDGRPASAADRVRAGNVIAASVPGTCFLAGSPCAEGAGNAADEKGIAGIDALFEGAGILAVNKPAGLAVHGPDRDNLNARVLRYLSGKIPPSLSFRPGALHRLDKMTSGAVVFSASLEGARSFSRMLREGAVRKTYLTILEGELRPPCGNVLWEDALERDQERRTSAVRNGGGKADGVRRAVTGVRPAAWACQTPSRPALTLACVEIETGITHQIRVQAAFHGHPLWGDRKYGGSGIRGFFLHALSLDFPPEAVSAFFPRTITAPLPECFTAAVTELFPASAFRAEADFDPRGFFPLAASRRL